VVRLGGRADRPCRAGSFGLRRGAVPLGAERRNGDAAEPVCGPVDHPAMAEDVYFDEELVVLTAPGVGDLNAYLAQPNLKIIVLRAGCSYRLILEGLLAKRGIVGFKVLEFGTPESIFATVSAGLGLTLFPEQLVGAVWPEGRVAMHRLDDDQGMVKTVFIRRRDTYASSALGAFLDIARAEWQPAQMAAEQTVISPCDRRYQI
jgi:LysR family transcriptional regulator, cell division regulator